MDDRAAPAQGWELERGGDSVFFLDLLLCSPASTFREQILAGKPLASSLGNKLCERKLGNASESKQANDQHRISALLKSVSSKWGRLLPTSLFFS